MKNTTEENVKYCKNLIRMAANERLLQLAFLPAELQRQALAYYALDAELKHVHQHVSEEMIGHIRYAWWREALDHIAEGKKQRHPVLIELAKSGIPMDALVALVDAYREAYPAMPEHPPELAIQHARYQKAGAIIQKHKSARWRLILKLLFV